MKDTAAADPQAPARPAGTVEFITIIATMMALTALSIDSMLPALPAIGETYGLSDPNARQLVITFYVLGFSAGQVVYGPPSDSFGRKPMLQIGLTVYALASLAVVFAGDFETLLVARAAQGFGCGAPRVIALAVVRDLYGGRRMARILSFVMMIFIIVPIVAPTAGQALMLIGHWQWIFLALLALSLLLMVATGFQLPETRPRGSRSRFSARWLVSVVATTLAQRQTLGYTLATGFIFGGLMAYINTAQQIFVGIYALGDYFPVVFGAVAITVALASWLNAHLVERLGMRRLSHAALVGFLATSLVNLFVALIFAGPPPLLVFCILLALSLFFFGFVMPNFNSLAMEPLQAVAGTASSFIGSFTTAAAAILGWTVGQHFDGTVLPLVAGYVVLSAVALTITAITERGRLFAAGDG
ncbi:MAG TPA: multidrug effflux MFS transporter [Hyphomicrobiales bacterium]|nr:multidrug effflux MFS transporter [Hyphomicrobiales bacterium]